MAAARITFDRTEIVVIILLKNKVKVLNLTYEDIVRIQLDPCEERRFIFQRVPSEKITIVTGKHNQPIVFLKSREKKHWDAYLKGLRDFAARNDLHLTDNLQS